MKCKSKAVISFQEYNLCRLKQNELHSYLNTYALELTITEHNTTYENFEKLISLMFEKFIDHYKLTFHSAYLL